MLLCLCIQVIHLLYCNMNWNAILQARPSTGPRELKPFLVISDKTKTELQEQAALIKELQEQLAIKQGVCSRVSNFQFGQ